MLQSNIYEQTRQVCKNYACALLIIADISITEANNLYKIRTMGVVSFLRGQNRDFWLSRLYSTLSCFLEICCRCYSYSIFVYITILNKGLYYQLRSKPSPVGSISCYRSVDYFKNRTCEKNCTDLKPDRTALICHAELPDGRESAELLRSFAGIFVSMVSSYRQHFGLFLPHQNALHDHFNGNWERISFSP